MAEIAETIRLLLLVLLVTQELLEVAEGALSVVDTRQLAVLVGAEWSAVAVVGLPL
jgi:hypothetical protein